MNTASESDFQKITNELGPDELHHLFHTLGISQRDIEHAEKSADTTDTRLKAIAVLCWWRKTEGKDATLTRLYQAKTKLCTATGRSLLYSRIVSLFNFLKLKGAFFKKQKKKKSVSFEESSLQRCV